MWNICLILFVSIAAKISAVVVNDAICRQKMDKQPLMPVNKIETYLFGAKPFVLFISSGIEGQGKGVSIVCFMPTLWGLNVVLAY